MELSKAVINGPKKHPGANAVLDELGNLTYLKEVWSIYSLPTISHHIPIANIFCYIQDDADSRLAISRTLRTVTQGKGSSGVKKVYRHIRTGDVVLVNRQPSLHKPSMMAHKVITPPSSSSSFLLVYADSVLGASVVHRKDNPHALRQLQHLQRWLRRWWDEHPFSSGNKNAPKTVFELPILTFSYAFLNNRMSLRELKPMA